MEKDHDATTAAALEAVERRGEMLVRVLDPRQMGRQACEAARTFLTMQVRRIYRRKKREREREREILLPDRYS